jgi:transcriptional regulator with XRE-family HTH domain
MAKAAFSEQLMLSMKAIALSRGQLAADLGVDKSVVSRWLSGATVPTDHNLARLTARVARDVPGFTMLDWEQPPEALRLRLGLAQPEGNTRPTTEPAIVADLAQPLVDLPDFARLPAFAPARHETAARAARYCGLWRSWMPTVGRPDLFHCEHTVIWEQGGWLAGFALGVCYRWPLTGFIANGQLLLVFSDASDFVFRQFNRADQPIIDAVDGLMLAAASLPHQAPTACRVIMARVLDAGASRADIDAALAAREAERAFCDAEDLPPGMAEALLPDCGPKAEIGGGERLLRADPTLSQVRTRWF